MRYRLNLTSRQVIWSGMKLYRVFVASVAFCMVVGFMISILCRDSCAKDRDIQSVPMGTRHLFDEWDEYSLYTPEHERRRIERWKIGRVSVLSIIFGMGVIGTAFTGWLVAGTFKEENNVFEKENKKLEDGNSVLERENTRIRKNLDALQKSGSGGQLIKETRDHLDIAQKTLESHKNEMDSIQEKYLETTQEFDQKDREFQQCVLDKSRIEKEVLSGQEKLENHREGLWTLHTICKIVSPLYTETRTIHEEMNHFMGDLKRKGQKSIELGCCKESIKFIKSIQEIYQKGISTVQELRRIAERGKEPSYAKHISITLDPKFYRSLVLVQIYYMHLCGVYVGEKKRETTVDSMLYDKNIEKQKIDNIKDFMVVYKFLQEVFQNDQEFRKMRLSDLAVRTRDFEGCGTNVMTVMFLERCQEEIEQMYYSIVCEAFKILSFAVALCD